jgi:hypothetical protein
MQIRSIAKSIQSLKMASLNEQLSESEKIKYSEQVQQLQRAMDALLCDPNAIGGCLRLRKFGLVMSHVAPLSMHVHCGRKYTCSNSRVHLLMF